MYIHIYVCINICLSIYIYIHIYTYINMCVCVCVNTRCHRGHSSALRRYAVCALVPRPCALVLKNSPQISSSSLLSRSLGLFLSLFLSLSVFVSISLSLSLSGSLSLSHTHTYTHEHTHTHTQLPEYVQANMGNIIVGTVVLVLIYGSIVSGIYFHM